MNIKAERPAQKFHRRDGTGHLEPRYEADLLARSGRTGRSHADSAYPPARLRHDSMAEQLAEAFVGCAVSGEDQDQAVFGEFVSEEAGGPFVESSGAEEFARGTDESNPAHARREPFPRT